MFRLRARGQESMYFERFLDKESMGTTMDNNYYPLYTQELVARENITDEVFLYSNYDKGRYYGQCSKYDNFFVYFNFKLLPSRFSFITNSVTHLLIVSKGYIRTIQGKPLVMIGINKYFNNHYKNNEYTKNRDNVQPEYYDRFKVFIASEFMTNPIYKNVWKKFNTECMTALYDFGIPVEITTPDAITKQFFNDGFSLKFNSITEMQEHLNTVVPMIMAADLKYVAPPKAPSWNSIHKSLRETRYNRGEWYDEPEVVEAMRPEPIIPQEEWSTTTIRYDDNNVGTTTDYTLTSTDSSTTTWVSGTGEPTIIQGSGNTYDNVRIEGDVEFQGSNNIVRNSTIIGGSVREVPEPEVEDPNVVHVTPRIDLVDDTVEEEVVGGVQLDEDNESRTMIRDGGWTVPNEPSLNTPNAVDAVLTARTMAEIARNTEIARNVLGVSADSSDPVTYGTPLDVGALEQRMHEILGVPAERQGEAEGIPQSNEDVAVNLTDQDLDEETARLDAEARAMFGDDYDQEVNTNDENSE